MSLVILTGAEPQHRYVANVLCAELDVGAVLVETGRALTPQHRIRQLRRRYTTGQLAGRAALAAYKRAIKDDAAERAQLDQVLGERGRSFQCGDLITEVQSVNSDPARSLLTELDPTRLLVYGTGIVRDPVLELSREQPLNMHTGISPFYRGSSCAFWPIHNAEPEMCGATVHEITADIDAGAIFGTTTADLEPDDGLHAVFARTVVAGAALYAETVQRLATDPDPGTPQDLSVGREYRASMRGLRAELRARRLLAKGLLAAS